MNVLHWLHGWLYCRQHISIYQEQFDQRNELQFENLSQDWNRLRSCFRRCPRLPRWPFRIWHLVAYQMNQIPLQQPLGYLGQVLAKIAMVQGPAVRHELLQPRGVTILKVSYLEYLALSKCTYWLIQDGNPDRLTDYNWRPRILWVHSLHIRRKRFSNSQAVIYISFFMKSYSEFPQKWRHNYNSTYYGCSCIQH